MKQYETPEECIKINGEHAWQDIPSSGMACAVMHYDNYCDWDERRQKCYHCPATRRYARTVAPKFEWVDEKLRQQR